ncbi:DUF1540 domain-containing protein [Cohnella cholangitidis]|uniref:DUF1540 domain-containing protein n=1 Tax=Cohnella cholangitidis TaxID=2598458 RepID=A0A7G5BTX8_9BACL|nr:DUF1540 domain-containing protein [Cohnella cholangitidis]QMV40412.1 DUF1540 domain-containing protein [Cohnella cholangitidis]
MPNGVACSVNNCAYWNQGNRCGAQEIAIEVDSHASHRWNEEFADEFFTHRDSAPTSSVTCCLTFKPNGEK